MAIGTLTADGAEQLVDTLDPGVPGFVFWYVDLSNLDDGDEVIVRKRIDLNDDTYELFTVSKYAGLQDRPIINQSSNLLILSNVPVRVTLEQTAGTNRDYAWGTGVKHQMPESTERNLPVWRRDRGWSSPLTYTQPDNVAVSTSGGGSINFGSDGADFSAGDTAGDHAQMDAYGLRGSGDINFSWLCVREFAIANHLTSQTMIFNVGLGADESKTDGYIDYNPDEIMGQNQTVSVPSGISLSDFHWVRVIVRGLVDGYDDAVIVHFMQGDDAEEVVYADGVSTDRGGSREVAVYMESEGEATGTTHVAFCREYTTPPTVQLPFPDDGGRR